MEENKEKPIKQVNNYLKYSGIGFQIAGGIGAGVLLGWFIDKKMGNEKPYFTASLSILFLFASMYLAFKDLMTPPKKKD